MPVLDSQGTPIYYEAHGQGRSSSSKTPSAADRPILGVVGEKSWPRSITFMEGLDQAVSRTRQIRIADPGRRRGSRSRPTD